MDAPELSGARLDAWVALAQGHDAVRLHPGRAGRLECRCDRDAASGDICFSPSTDWTQAAPIVARERIAMRDMEGGRGTPAFEAMLRRGGVTWFAQGELPLVAAMRVYVLSRFTETELADPPFDIPTDP